MYTYTLSRVAKDEFKNGWPFLMAPLGALFEELGCKVEAPGSLEGQLRKKLGSVIERLKKEWKAAGVQGTELLVK